MSSGKRVENAYLSNAGFRLSEEGLMRTSMTPVMGVCSVLAVQHV